MAFPETEVLNSIVARVFRIEDITTGDPEKGLQWRYRGHLVSDDSVSAYDQLAAAVKPYGLTPLFRLEKGEQVIYLVNSPPKQKPANPWVNVILFVITIFSVMLAGALLSGETPPVLGTLAFRNLIGAWLGYIFTGWPFALAMLGILVAHEFGHYLVSRYHKTPATLPYFIPFPLSPLGTMGAAILMKGIPKNKRILFDIGVAGPLAGMLIAIPVLFLGLSLSSLSTIDAAPGSFIEGNSSSTCSQNMRSSASSCPNRPALAICLPSCTGCVISLPASLLPLAGWMSSSIRWRLQAGLGCW
jgi:hypothetical protein